MSFNETIIAHAITGLRALKDGSAQMCVTSPPYFGLRAYGTPPQDWGDWTGELGQEPTPDMYISHLVSVFREVRQVLRNDGTLWLNLGDSYAGSGKGQMGDGSHSLEHGTKQGTSKGTLVGGLSTYKGLPAKNLLGVPWRTAIALQADGWILRNAIIWHKPNPMPSSQRDRFTNSYEHLFLFSKSKKYYLDLDAVQEPAVSDHKSGNAYKRPESLTRQNADGTPRGSDLPWTNIGGMRTRRDVWTITVASYKGAHFATFPPKLVEPCILAGSPPESVVLDPFGGSGTVGMVSKRLGRNSVCIDLNADYADLSKQRIAA